MRVQVNYKTPSVHHFQFNETVMMEIILIVKYSVRYVQNVLNIENDNTVLDPNIKYILLKL